MAVGFLAIPNLLKVYWKEATTVQIDVGGKRRDWLVGRKQQLIKDKEKRKKRATNLGLGTNLPLPETSSFGNNGLSPGRGLSGEA